jgi:hypothetical protein
MDIRQYCGADYRTSFKLVYAHWKHPLETSYGIKWFITMPITAHNCILSWITGIKCISSHSKYLNSILILSSYVPGFRNILL